MVGEAMPWCVSGSMETPKVFDASTYPVYFATHLPTSSSPPVPSRFLVAYRASTACITLNEMPFIRYSSSARGISEVVARALAKSLMSYCRDTPSYKPWGDARSRADDDLVGECSAPLIVWACWLRAFVGWW